MPSRRRNSGACLPSAEATSVRGLEAFDELIRSRRTHKSFGPEPVPADTLDELLELARWAPNHHRTNPWRFRVLGPETLDRLRSTPLSLRAYTSPVVATPLLALPPSDANACVQPSARSFCFLSGNNSASHVIAATNSTQTPMKVVQRKKMNVSSVVENAAANGDSA